MLYPPELDPGLDGAAGLLYPPDDGLLYKPDDDGREEVDEDLDEEEDENPLAASRLVTHTNANTKQKTSPTRVSLFVM